MQRRHIRPWALRGLAPRCDSLCAGWRCRRARVACGLCLAWAWGTTRRMGRHRRVPGGIQRAPAPGRGGSDTHTDERSREDDGISAPYHSRGRRDVYSSALPIRGPLSGRGVRGRWEQDAAAFTRRPDPAMHGEVLTASQGPAQRLRTAHNRIQKRADAATVATVPATGSVPVHSASGRTEAPGLWSHPWSPAWPGAYHPSSRRVRLGSSSGASREGRCTPRAGEGWLPYRTAGEAPRGSSPFP
jgi:hypothetical protein